jgi:two-component system response regulator YesN
VKILIVEDELLERKAMVHLVENEFEGITAVLMADNGKKAVDMALAEKPELVLMDINLPLLDGISAAEQIHEKNPECRIIMVSAYSDYEHLRGSIRTRALDYLIKPYSVETFVEAVKRGIGIEDHSDGQTLYGKAGIIQKVKKYLEKHYESNISLQDVSDEICLDKSYLGRLFREECGITVMGYLREIRIKKAKEFLGRGMNPSEVAEKTGFGDPAYFAKTFRQAVGVSPSRYRENKIYIEECRQ